MNTSATRAWTLLALGILTAISAAAWTLPLWARVSERGDDTDLSASATLTIVTFIVAANAMRARHDRQARVRNLSLIMPLIAPQVTPRGGDGQDQPQPRQQHWYRYLNEPAA